MKAAFNHVDVLLLVIGEHLVAARSVMSSLFLGMGLLHLKAGPN